MENIKNHVNHSKLEFSNNAGLANINVITGRLLFERADIAVGVNSYAIGVSHIYDNHALNASNNYFGKGWKLSIQQYLQEISKKDENGNALYLYTDAYGYQHEFEYYETVGTTKKYFDRTGLGLTLNLATTPYIEDGQGDKMYFAVEVNGVKLLTSTVSGLNAKIKFKAGNDLGQATEETLSSRSMARKKSNMLFILDQVLNRK